MFIKYIDVISFIYYHQSREVEPRKTGNEERNAHILSFICHSKNAIFDIAHIVEKVFIFYFI